MTLPENHPSRIKLNDEVHARPSTPIETPARISYIAMHTPEQIGENDWQPLVDLAARYEAIPPRPGSNHYAADLGGFRLRWERHTEFTRYTFLAPGGADDPFHDPALNLVPGDWIENLPGTVLMAAHLAVVDEKDVPGELAQISSKYFAGHTLFGSSIADGAARAIKDFRIHGDRFSRMLVINNGMNTRQTGNMVQRLLEIDTYRLLTLMALPVARDLAPFLAEQEQILREITADLASTEASDEPALLERLTHLQVACESRYVATNYRFSAAEAYYELVQRRIEELREVDYPGLQSLQEFSDRRLTPARNTCTAMSRRLATLSERAARATQLLSTRVEIDRQQQSQKLLETMNRRTAAQLKLQQTVEGLSGAAITYYIVGLVGYLAIGVAGFGFSVDPKIAQGLSVPLVLLFVILGIRRLRKSIADKPDAKPNA